MLALPHTWSTVQERGGYGLMPHHQGDPKGVDLEMELPLLGDLLLAHHAATSRGLRHRTGEQGAKTYAARKRTR
jgi:hypothetical protein